MRVKKVLSLLLCVTLLVSLTVSFIGCDKNVQPEDGSGVTVMRSGECGDSVLWNLDENGVLTVSGNGAMNDYASSEHTPWAQTRGEIKKIVISQGVTKVGAWSFADCENASDVTLADSVETIGNSAFEKSNVENVYYDGETGIWEDVTVCEGNSSLLKAVLHVTYTPEYYAAATSGACGDGVTWSLDSAGKLTISGNGTMTDYTQLSSSRAPWFDSYSSVKSVVIQSGVKSIGDYAFYYCINLTSVTIPEGITSIGKFAFDECKSLSSLTVPSSTSTISDDAFSGSSLSSIKVNSNNANYSSDTNGVLFNKNKTTLIRYPLYSSISSYTVPSTVETISGKAFDSSRNLKSLTLGSAVTLIKDGAFSDCTELSGITVAEGNKYYSSDKTGVLFNANKTTLIKYPSANTAKTYVVPSTVTTIGKEAFCNADKLTNIGIGLGVSNISERAFYDCSSVEVVLIPDNVKKIGAGAFDSCTKLSTLSIGNGVTEIGKNAFSFCFALQHISLGSSVKTIGDFAFAEATRAVNITLPVSVTSIGYGAFENCEMKNVYYQGTEAKWNAVSVGECNDSLQDAKKHFLNGTHSHAYGSWKTLRNADCTAYGEKYRICSGCSYVLAEYASAQDHSFSEWAETGEISANGNPICERHCSCGLSQTAEYLGLTVVTLPAKTVYNKGEALKLDGLVVAKEYSGGIFVNVDGYTVSGYNSDKLGTQTVTVTYKSETCSFTVTVKTNGVSGFVSPVSEGTTASQIKKMYTAYSVTVFDKDGKTVLSDNAVLKTGQIIQLSDGNAAEMLYIRVAGDATGDGIVNGKDLIRINKQIKGGYAVTHSEFADANNDGAVNASDLEFVVNAIIIK